MSARRAACAAIAVLGALAVARAFTLELDPYDGYEVRSSARAIAGDAGAPFAIYRAPVLVLLEAPFEKWGRGSRAAWVFPHLVGALAYVALALGTRRLARAAGASEVSSAVVGVAVALDRLAFADAPLGLPDGLGAAFATWGLAVAFEERFVLTAILLGLAAATKPNDGLACLGLLPLALSGADRLIPGTLSGADRAFGPIREVEGSRLRPAMLSCAGAAAIFVAVSSLYFALGGKGGFVELARFQREQFAENYARYGEGHPRLLVYLRALWVMEPGTALLAPFALVVARGRSLGLVAVALAQLVFLLVCVGHAEARYLVPVLPLLAALGALLLDRVTNARARGALLGAWLVLPLLLGARFECARALDPVFRRNPSAEIAREVAAVSTSGRVSFVPDLPFPVYPRALGAGGTPFEGDPFHGIHHLGPLTIGYHLGRPVLLGLVRDERGEPVSDEALVEAVSRNPSFSSGDVLLVGARTRLSWEIPEEPPPFRIFVKRSRFELAWSGQFR